MNKFPLLNKTLVIGLLVLLLTIPLTMVQSLVGERTAHRNLATQDVARASAGAQTVVGPVLWVPYTEAYPVTVDVPDRLGQFHPGQTRVDLRERSGAALIFPSALDLKSQVETEQRMRGIFPVTVFNSRHEGQGRFVWKPPVAQMKDGQIKLGQPMVLLGVSDARGLRSAPQLRMGSESVVFAPSPADANAPLPLAARVPLSTLQAEGVMAFDMTLEVAGTGRLGFVPLADENTVSLTSEWPHPSFDGSFLPLSREVGDTGFTARWSVPSLSSRAQTQFMRLAQWDAQESVAASSNAGAARLADEERRAEAGQASNNGAHGNPFAGLEQFSVALQDPVDIYHLTDRATKYGMMFVVLTFAAFFVLEMVKRWRIHPMQYLMVGAALVLFFLLLLSISEHLPFAAAYAMASAACIGLLGHYLRYVLGSWRAGMGMSGMLVALYGVIYGILLSEDNALMMGSLLLFGVLAAIMIATRKLDWYGVLRSEARPVEAVLTKEAGA